MKLSFIFFLRINFLIILFSCKSTFGQWNQVDPGTSTTLNDIFFVNDTLGFIAGAYTILRTTDQGNTWEEHLPSLLEDFQFYSYTNFESIYFFDDQIGLAIGNTFGASTDPIIFKTTNGGLDWFKVYHTSTNGSTYLYDMSFYNNQEGIICGSDGLLFKTIDQGDNWFSLPSIGSNDILKIQTPTPNIYYIQSGSFIRKTYNGGNSWSSTNANSVIDIHFTSASRGFFCTDNLIRQTFDSASSWQTIDKIFEPENKSLFFLGDSAGYIVTNQTIYFSSNNAQNWEAQVMNTYSNNIQLKKMHMHSSGTGGVIGWNSNVLVTNNGGGNPIPSTYSQVDSYNKCFGDTFYFTSLSLASNQFQWMVDGVLESTNQDFIFVPSSAGIFQVSLVTDNGFNTDTALYSIQVDGIPVASYSYIADDLSVQFSNLSASANTSIWQINGETINDFNPSYTFPATNPYEVCLEVSNSCATEIDTLCDTVFVDINHNNYLFDSEITDPDWYQSSQAAIKTIPSFTGGYKSLVHSSTLGGQIGRTPLLAQVDAGGNISWIKFYKDSAINYTVRPINLIPTPDSNYIMHFHNNTLVRVNDLGNLVWAKSPVGNSINSIVKINDSLMAILELEQNKTIIYFTDFNLNPINQFSLGLTTNLYGIIAAKPHNDNLLILVKGGSYYFLTEVTSLGAVLWTKKIPLPEYPLSMAFNDIEIMDNDNIFLVGQTDYMGISFEPISSILCLNSSGNILWHKGYHPLSLGVSFIIDNNAIMCTKIGDDLVVKGQAGNPYHKDWLFCINPNGLVKWSHEIKEGYGNSAVFDYNINSIDVLDSSFIVSGGITSQGNVHSPVKIKKFNFNGLSCDSLQTIDMETQNEFIVIEDTLINTISESPYVLSNKAFIVDYVTNFEFNNCYKPKDSVQMEQLSATFLSDNICSPSDSGSINIQASAGFIYYSIDNGITFQSESTFNNLPSGNYNVLVTNLVDTILLQNIFIDSVNLPVNITNLSSSYCAESSAHILIGSPSGGVFTGQGISQDNFDPSQAPIGPNTIYYSIDSLGCLFVDSQTTYVDYCTNTESLLKNSLINLYPNPNTKSFSINHDFEQVDITITNTNGSIIYQKNGLGQNELIEHNLSKGVYFLSIKNHSTQIDKMKIIVH